MMTHLVFFGNSNSILLLTFHLIISLLLYFITLTREPDYNAKL